MALKALSKELHPSLGTFDGVTAEWQDLKPSPNFCGRVELAEIAKFKRDFMDKKVGQIQPISVWKHPETQKAWIIDGVTRWNAARDVSEETGVPFRLKCLYLQCATEQEAFILTIKANIRGEIKQADNIHNVAVCRYNLMLEEDDIAGRVYGRFTLQGDPDVKWVQEMLALNNLTPESITALKAGRVKSKAAVALAKLTPDKQREKLAELKEGQTLTVAAIKRAANANGAGPAASAAASSTQSTSEAPAIALRAGKQPKLTIPDVCGKLQEWIDMDLPPHIARMDAENAIRTVLGQIQEEIQCGK